MSAHAVPIIYPQARQIWLRSTALWAILRRDSTPQTVFRKVELSYRPQSHPTATDPTGTQSLNPWWVRLSLKHWQRAQGSFELRGCRYARGQNGKAEACLRVRAVLYGQN